MAGHLFSPSLFALLLVVRLFRLLALRWGCVRDCFVLVRRSSFLLLVFLLQFVRLLTACVIVPGPEKQFGDSMPRCCLYIPQHLSAGT